jgi:hypothetical protein
MRAGSSSSTNPISSINSSPIVSLMSVEDLVVTNKANSIGNLSTLKRDSKAAAGSLQSPSVMSSRPNFYPSPSGMNDVV